jgi:hypothetical protein
MKQESIFGAYASVCIRFDGTLKVLADKLAGALELSGFEVKTSEYPPHNEIGSAGALGCELWLEATHPEGQFNLELRTTHAVEEIFHGRMHDLSPWLARFLAMMCDLNVTPATPDSPPQ